MNKEFDVHPIQATILVKLLLVKEAAFSEININRISSDLLSFHLKQLLNWNLVEKIDGKYRLSTKGKEFANRFDTDRAEVEKQAKVAVLLVATKLVKNKRYYLLQQRLKQPYFGYWGFASGKIKWGEKLEEATKRELLEETGLSGIIKLKGVKHKMDYDQNGKILEDKYFYIHLITNVKGELKAEFEGGKNVWLTRMEILKMDKLFDGVEDSIKMAMSNKFSVMERSYKVKGY